MADLPFSFPNSELSARLAAVLDAEGKIPQVLDALGPIAGRDVLLIGADGDRRASQLRALGGRVTATDSPGLGESDRIAPASVDVVVACWDALGRPTPDAERAHAQVCRLLRPGGTLLLLTDYGRDDVARLVDDVDPATELARSRARDTWFISRGFKVRVIHAWWTFESLESAADFLGSAFGDRGRSVAARMSRPRLAHKLVVYHRAQGEGGSARGAGVASREAEAEARTGAGAGSGAGTGSGAGMPYLGPGR